MRVSGEGRTRIPRTTHTHSLSLSHTHTHTCATYAIAHTRDPLPHTPPTGRHEAPLLQAYFKPGVHFRAALPAPRLRVVSPLSHIYDRRMGDLAAARPCTTARAIAPTLPRAPTQPHTRHRPRTHVQHRDRAVVCVGARSEVEGEGRRMAPIRAARRLRRLRRLRLLLRRARAAFVGTRGVVPVRRVVVVLFELQELLL